jgi:beta-ureidopropionase / N-carbamoyl-L-amino-acid hydrolase
MLRCTIFLHHNVLVPWQSLAALHECPSRPKAGRVFCCNSNSSEAPATMTKVTINPERLLSDLYELRQIGAYKTGVHRPTLSHDDMVSRRWLAAKLEAIGHEATIDGIANVFGRTPAPGKKLLAGSHIETQNYSGWLDGAMGVIFALEAARAVQETPALAGTGIDVIAFADEEGHFGNFFGSYSFVGELSEQTIDEAKDRTNGTPLRAALAEAGLASTPRIQIEPGRYAGFLEAHIEQGDWLESQALTVGIVTSIVSIMQYRIVIEGTQNHAGTTRMAIRRDAGRAAVEVCNAINATFPRHVGDRSVWTVGRITLEPGGPSIIPGRAEVLFQFRDADPEKLLELEKVLQTIIAEANRSSPCDVRLETISKSIPAVMDSGIQDAFEKAATEHCPGKFTRMPSGAGHDAQVMARYLPSGMLFVPSIGGISHHWTENTADEDIVMGARVYASAAGQLLAHS